MANFTVTYTFIANTKARSSEVNQNFTDVLNILKAHHHDPNIYSNASPITTSGIAPNANIQDTQLQANVTRSGLINPLALQTVTVPKGGLGLMSVIAGDMVYGDSQNVYKTLPIGNSGQVLTVSANRPSWQDPPPSIFNYFGDGSDGDVTISSNTTISRDMYYNNLTINGGNLDTDGWKVFVKGTLTIFSGYKIHNNGNDGSAGTVGQAGDSGGAGGAGGGGGGAKTTGTVYGGKAGGDGANGGAGGVNGTDGFSGSNSSSGSVENVSITQVAGKSGGAGGAGGNAGAGGVGGSGGTVGTPGAAGTAPVFGIPHTWLQLFRWLDPTTSLWAAFAQYKSGSQSTGGGGGGGGGTTHSGGNQKGGGGGGGGGAGSSAGTLWVAAYTIVNNGTMECKGGAGGNGGAGGQGGSTGSGFPGSGGAGGGGGGGGQGGVILRIYHTLSGSGSTNVSGGAAGSGGAGGLKGTGTSAPYSDGASGSSGTVGNDGTVLSYTV